MSSMEPYSKSSSMPITRRRSHGIVRVDGAYSLNQSAEVKTVLDVRSLDGFKHPRWRQLVKLGRDATTPLSASRTTYNIRRHSAEEVRTYTWKGAIQNHYPASCWFDGDYFTSGPWPTINGSLLVAQANNLALTDFVSNANDARRIIQSGELVGELAEVVRMVKSPGKSLFRGIESFIDSVKKRCQRARTRSLPAHRRATEQSKIMSDTWLEYQFGWRPLVSEISDAFDYVNEKDPFAHHDTRKVQGVGVAEDAVWRTTSQLQRTATTPGFTAKQRDFARAVVIYRASMGMATSAAGYTAEKLGFASNQWLPTAWELVPYSFLIDYFTPIGDLINAASFPRGQLNWIVKTVVVDTTSEFVDCKPIWKWNPPNGSNSRATWTGDRRLYSLGRAGTTIHTVERESYNGSLYPSWEFSIPGSGTRWLNMAALFSRAKGVQNWLSS